MPSGHIILQFKFLLFKIGMLKKKIQFPTLANSTNISYMYAIDPGFFFFFFWQDFWGLKSYVDVTSTNSASYLYYCWALCEKRLLALSHPCMCPSEQEGMANKNSKLPMAWWGNPMDSNPRCRYHLTLLITNLHNPARRPTTGSRWWPFFYAFPC